MVKKKKNENIYIYSLYMRWGGGFQCFALQIYTLWLLCQCKFIYIYIYICLRFLFDIDSCFGICYKYCIFLTSFNILLNFCYWNPPFCWDPNNSGLDQKYSNLTKSFWTKQTEDWIQIKTKIGFCDLILIQNTFFFWTTRFQDLIQS